MDINFIYSGGFNNAEIGFGEGLLISQYVYMPRSPATPPLGYVFLVNNNGNYLTNELGNYLTKEN